MPDLPAIRRKARLERKMPSAGGKLIYGVSGFLPYIDAGSVDIVMPYVKYCGGMLELKKIAALAEAAGLTVSPHGPASPVGNEPGTFLRRGSLARGIDRPAGKHRQRIPPSVRTPRTGHQAERKNGCKISRRKSINWVCA